MPEITRLYLKPGKEKSLERGHPWIFSGAIDSYEGTLQEGGVVEVVDQKEKHLGYGHFQNGSIMVRLLTTDGTFPDHHFYIDRIRSAWNLRKALGLTDSSETSIFRVIHGEGDYLPGLIADYYAGHVIIQCHSIGMYVDIEMIRMALLEVCGSALKSIYLKCTGTLPKEYTGYRGDYYLLGDAETPVVALEHGNRFYVDWINGQKTGFFVDQRENRLLLGQYAQGKKILNTFCYSGGFSVYALHCGAELVHSLDASQKAIELTDANIQLGNFTDGRHASFVGDTMDFIKDLREDYDIIILDPPAFAKHRNAKHNAVQGYKRLNAHAIRQIKPGGIIFTFSCSQVVDKELFTNTIIAAAIEAKRKVRILEQLHQPADHPVNTNHPEGEYLKGLVIYVE